MAEAGADLGLAGKAHRVRTRHGTRDDLEREHLAVRHALDLEDASHAAFAELARDSVATIEAGADRNVARLHRRVALREQLAELTRAFRNLVTEPIWSASCHVPNGS